MKKIWDAVVVGGGPAGLAAAIALRQRGLDCMVVDAMQPPIDKACGEGLMPDAREALAQLGVEVTPEDGAVFRGILFTDARSTVRAQFPEGVGIGVRRLFLHQRLADHAAQKGVALRWGTTAELLRENKLSIGGEEISARWMIGADGQSSRFRKWAGLERTRSLSTRYGFRRHYEIQPWSDQVEIHWGPRGQIYVTPVSEREICVAFITRDPHIRLEGALQDFPVIAARLDEARITSRDRGSVTATRTLAHVYRGANVLIGDASGSADAITGEGMATSFRQAVALADAVVHNDLSAYESAHHQIARLPQSMARIMLLMDRWPQLQRRALAVLANEPAYFQQLLAVHVGQASLPEFLLRRGPAFAWKLLASNSAWQQADEVSLP
ncbi:MAG: NAD(P)/FAD-dependent oxidoreductase [Acidobacteriaceae bacterium]